MPEKRTIERARKAEREGKAPSTVAGEFVREEIDHVREGKHGVRSPKQAIAIGLSKARRAGVPLPAPTRGRASASVRKRAKRDLARGKTPRAVSPKRSEGVKRALRREGRSAASPRALAYQARAARGRGKKSAARTPKNTPRKGANQKNPRKSKGGKRTQ